MIKASVYNFNDEKVKDIELSEGVFSAPWNDELVFQCLYVQQSNSRNVVAHAKGRGEVRGGGRKPWKQKGTGRARHGSVRSPLWIGGGVTHGPRKDKDYSKKINRKAKRAGIFAVLSLKLKDGNLKIFSGFDELNKEKKTKNILKSIKPMIDARSSNLFVLSDENKNLNRALRNITKVSAISSKSLNVVDLLKAKNIFVDERAVSDISKHYKK